MMTSKHFSFCAACLFAWSAPAATYDFTSGASSTNGWQPYSPLAGFGAAATFSDGAAGYRLQSPASPSPSQLGPARVGSFLPDIFSDFSITFSVLSYSSSPSDFFGAGARMSTIGLGATSGYAMGYDNSSGALVISKVVDEATKSLGAAAAAPVALVPGQGYEFTFQGSGTALSGAVYSLGNLSTPLASVSASDSQFASGQVGLLAADESSGGAGTADVTFGGFSVIPEPGSLSLFLFGIATLWAAAVNRKR